jgi:hypothetical protein
MISEFRLILTGTFTAAADRDACYNSLKTQVQGYATANPGKLKRADMTRDDYFIADAQATEKVV